MKRTRKDKIAVGEAPPTVWARADPAALAAFDPRTKLCTENCGPSSTDPRSAIERKFLCEDCIDMAAPVLIPKGIPMAFELPGDNRLELNQATIMKIVEKHINASMLSSPLVRVTSMIFNEMDCYATFELTTDPEGNHDAR